MNYILLFYKYYVQVKQARKLYKVHSPSLKAEYQSAVATRSVWLFVGQA